MHRNASARRWPLALAALGLSACLTLPDVELAEGGEGVGFITDAGGGPGGGPGEGSWRADDPDPLPEDALPADQSSGGRPQDAAVDGGLESEEPDQGPGTQDAAALVAPDCYGEPGRPCVITVSGCAWAAETACLDGRMVCAAEPPTDAALAVCAACADGSAGDLAAAGPCDAGPAAEPGAWRCVDGIMRCEPEAPQAGDTPDEPG